MMINYHICTMNKESSHPTLLLLAAGMGSRYGGLKQMDAFGPSGETLLDYSIYDAIKAGFKKVVFVIREDFNEAFRAFFKGKFDDVIQVEYVYQDISDVPPGLSYDLSRTKPWGTSHAVWAARHVINEPFAVINADDFYGSGVFNVIKEYFDTCSKDAYGLVGYHLINTASDYGTVNRGVCQVNDSQQLTSIVETIKIGKESDGNLSYTLDGKVNYLAPDTVVSMNFWAFQPDYFDFCGAMFKDFIINRGFEEKSEFFIPLVVEKLIKQKTKSVDVIDCDEEWFGVTYQEDKPHVQKRLRQLIEKGVYPEKLWT